MIKYCSNTYSVSQTWRTDFEQSLSAVSVGSRVTESVMSDDVSRLISVMYQSLLTSVDRLLTDCLQGRKVKMIEIKSYL